MTALRRFWNREQGQDLVEWALLIALVVLGSAALMYNSGSSVARVWTTASATLVPTPAAPSAPASSPVTAPSGGDHEGH